MKVALVQVSGRRSQVLSHCLCSPSPSQQVFTYREARCFSQSLGSTLHILCSHNSGLPPILSVNHCCALLSYRKEPESKNY